MNMHEVPSNYGSRVNTTLGLRIGSTTSGKRKTKQPFANPSDYIAKQAPCHPDSYSKVTRYKDDGALAKLTVHFAKAEPILLCWSRCHLKTGKLENDLRPCVKFWQQSSKFCPLKEMTQVPSFSLRSTYVFKLSASKNVETALGNQCSNLLFLETDRCFLSLLLICVFLMVATG